MRTGGRSGPKTRGLHSKSSQVSLTLRPPPHKPPWCPATKHTHARTHTRAHPHTPHPGAQQLNTPTHACTHTHMHTPHPGAHQLPTAAAPSTLTGAGSMGGRRRGGGGLRFKTGQGIGWVGKHHKEWRESPYLNQFLGTSASSLNAVTGKV